MSWIWRTAIPLLPGSTAILPSTEVYDNQPGRHLTVIWTDRKREQIQSIIVAAPHSVWHTSEGLTVGTSLRELEQINGRPFQFCGFGPAQGGLRQRLERRSAGESPGVSSLFT